MTASGACESPLRVDDGPPRRALAGHKGTFASEGQVVDKPYCAADGYCWNPR